MASAEFGGICPVTRCAKHMLNGARAAARPAIAAKFQPKRYTMHKVVQARLAAVEPVAQVVAAQKARVGAARKWQPRDATKRSGGPGGYPPRAPTDPDVQISRIRLLMLRFAAIR